MDRIGTWIKGRFSSFRSRIIFLCCCIGVSAAVVLTVSFLLFYRNAMKREYQNQVKSHLEDTAVVFSGYMENLSSLAINWYRSNDGTLARVDGDYNIIEHMSFLNNIRNTMSSLGYIHSFYVIDNDGDVVFWTRSGGSYTEDLSEGLIEQLKKNRNTQPFFSWNVKHLYMDTPVHLLSCQISEAPYGDAAYTGSVVLNVDLDELQKRMFQNAQGTVQIAVTDPDNMVVLDSNADWIGQQNDLGAMSQEENSYHLSVPSGVNGFMVNAWYSYSDRLTTADDFFWITIVLFVVLGMVTIVAVLFGNRIARPLTRTVQQIRKNQEEQASFIENEGRDELRFLEKYAQNVACYVQHVKENDQKNRIIYNLLRNDKKVNIQPLLLEREIVYEGAGYWAVAVDFVCNDKNADIDMLGKIRKEAASRISTALGTEWKNSCYEHGLRYLLFLITETRERIAKNKEKDQDGDSEYKTKQIESCLQNAFKELSEQYPNVEFYLVLSLRMKDGTIPCKPLVHQINNRLDALRIRRHFGVDSERTNTGRIRPQEKTQEACLTALKKEDRESYQKAVKDMLEETSDASYTEMISWVADMADRINSVKAAMHREYKKADISELYEEAEQMESEEELLEWFDSFYDSISEKIGQVKQTTTAGLAEEAVDYILEHFSDDELGAYSLAQRLHISPQYFGQLFHDFTGKSVTEYIIQVRMEKARNYLLTRPDLEMMEVARRVGYRSASYFSTAFKKYYGVSPSKLHSSLNAEQLLSAESESISKD